MTNKCELCKKAEADKLVSLYTFNRPVKLHVCTRCFEEIRKTIEQKINELVKGEK